MGGFADEAATPVIRDALVPIVVEQTVSWVELEVGRRGWLPRVSGIRGAGDGSWLPPDHAACCNKSATRPHGNFHCLLLHLDCVYACCSCVAAYVSGERASRSGVVLRRAPFPESLGRRLRLLRVLS
jgi:hypothetical protein